MRRHWRRKILLTTTNQRVSPLRPSYGGETRFPRVCADVRSFAASEIVDVLGYFARAGSPASLREDEERKTSRSEVSPGDAQRSEDEGGKGVGDRMSANKASKKKAKKKERKKQRNAGKVGVGTRVLPRETGGQRVGEEDPGASAKLLAEGSLLESRSGREGWVRGVVGARASSKVVIICDQGFEPNKSLEVPVKAIVSIRDLNVLGATHEFRQRAIFFVGPNARDSQVSSFVPCCIKTNPLSTCSLLRTVLESYVRRRNVHPKADIAFSFLCDRM